MSAPGPFNSAALDRVLDTFPVLCDRRSMIALPGGTGNHTYRVQTVSGGDYAVRVPDRPGADRGVDWRVELVNVRLAAAAGVAPPVVEADPDIGLLVTRFIDGQPLIEADLDDARTLRAVATLLHRLHAIEGFTGQLDVAQTFDGYLDQVRRRALPLPAGFSVNEPKVRQLLRQLAERPEPVVACHNDANPANFLRSKDRLWLVDFEFAASGEPSFDLGNLINEFLLDGPRADALVDVYWEQSSIRRRARARAWSVVTGYVWMLWATLQSAAQPVEREQLLRRANVRYRATASWLSASSLEKLQQGINASD